MTQIRYVLQTVDGRYFSGIYGAERRYTDNPWGAFYRSALDSVWYYRNRFATGKDKETVVCIEREI